MIAVIIITYNAMQWVNLCLLPLKELAKNGFVYIIDNSSTDGTQDFIRLNFPYYKLIQLKENIGFGKANNIGLEVALKDGCNFFLLLNQDASISIQNIYALKNLLIRHQDFGIISPLQLHSDTIVDSKHLRTLLSGGNDYFNDLICGNELQEIYELNYTNAAIWMISKNCLKKVGGFEPLFPHYGEDSEYSYRLKPFKIKFGFAPEIIGYHYRNQNSKRNQNEIYYYNIFLVQLKSYDNSLNNIYLKLFIRLLVSSIDKVYRIRQFHIIEMWSAFFKLLRKYRVIKKHRDLNLIKNYFFLNFNDETKLVPERNS